LTENRQSMLPIGRRNVRKPQEVSFIEMPDDLQTSGVPPVSYDRCCTTIGATLSAHIV